MLLKDAPIPLLFLKAEPIPLLFMMDAEYFPLLFMMIAEYFPIWVPPKLDAPKGVAKWHWETLGRFRPADFPKSQSDWWAAVDSLGPRHCSLVDRRLSSLLPRSFL